MIVGDRSESESGGCQTGSEGAVRRESHDGAGERRAFDIGAVEGDQDGNIFVGRHTLRIGDGCIIHRSEGDRDGRGCRSERAITRGVSEAYRRGGIGGRVKHHGTVGSNRIKGAGRGRGDNCENERLIFSVASGKDDHDGGILKGRN